MSFFGINLKKIRKLKSISQKEMAEIISLKRAALGAYEEGRSEPKIDTIIKFANYFSISIDDLLKRELSINELLKFNTRITTDETKLREAYPRIPIITKEIASSYLKYYDKAGFIENMPYVEWPVKKGNKEVRAFEIQDLEMSNNKGGLYPEDIIILEKALLSDYKEEILGLVVYTDLKFRTLVQQDNQVQLKASHPAIEDIRINKEDIKEFWIPIGWFQKYRELNVET